MDLLSKLARRMIFIINPQLNLSVILLAQSIKLAKKFLKKLQGENKYFKETEGYIRLERVKLRENFTSRFIYNRVISDIEFNGVLIKYKVDLSNSESIHIIEKNDGLSRHIIKEKSLCTLIRVI